MNKAPEKNVQIGNHIFNLNEVCYMEFVDREISHGGPKLYLKFYGSEELISITFDNQEIFYFTKVNILKLKNAVNIDTKLFDSPIDNYLSGEEKQGFREWSGMK